jgi:hypothetical protein
VRTFGVATITMACLCSAALGATLHVDTFDSGTAAWAGGSAPTHQPTGGVGGGGFLEISSSGGNLATFNDAAVWTGDLAGAGAARVAVHLRSPATSAPLAIRLVLFGPSSTNDRWVSATARQVPNDGVWRHYTFELGAGDLLRVQGGGTHAQLMASTLRVMFRHDPAGSPSGWSRARDGWWADGSRPRPCVGVTRRGARRPPPRARGAAGRPARGGDRLRPASAPVAT